MLILINVVALERIRELIPQSLKENRLHFHTWFKLVLNQKLFNIPSCSNQFSLPTSNNFYLQCNAASCLTLVSILKIYKINYLTGILQDKFNSNSFIYSILRPMVFHRMLL